MPQLSKGVQKAVSGRVSEGKAREDPDQDGSASQLEAIRPVNGESGDEEEEDAQENVRPGF
jgi:hypothetical protein